ncbi:MAG TPA: 2-amino-4-hydroxy-6-hydroxymethyldihydropteridine diphosphokinase [Candidatus Deferrimicrobium sp.]|nr:2-amino-4-hydroxy-6-hydroxymethyldihydropteridine diphosphokinase [Candidatus Deferrimicrobium sp.]
MSETVYILMGSNMGDRDKNLSAALAQLEMLPGLEVVAVSGIYISEAEEMPPDSPAFLNQVVACDYAYLPGELLNALEAIEKTLGRTGKGQRQPRTIDLDILLFGERIVETERLSIPHPKLLNRPFAMVPLLQIEPGVVHPVTKSPVAEFLTDRQRRQVLLYKEYVTRNA